MNFTSQEWFKLKGGPRAMAREAIWCRPVNNKFSTVTRTEYSKIQTTGRSGISCSLDFITAVTSVTC